MIANLLGVAELALDAARAAIRITTDHLVRHLAPRP